MTSTESQNGKVIRLHKPNPLTPLNSEKNKLIDLLPNVCFSSPLLVPIHKILIFSSNNFSAIARPGKIWPPVPPAQIKTLVFSFILATVPAFHGFYMKGGALDVGKASTQSFYWTSIIIIIVNYIITQLLLS